MTERRKIVMNGPAGARAPAGAHLDRSMIYFVDVKIVLCWRGAGPHLEPTIDTARGIS